MIYLTLDTCAWFEIIKTDWNYEYNAFEEICFWIEKKYIIHIVPENMLREWDRHKVSRSLDIIDKMKLIAKNMIQPFKANSTLNSIYEEDNISKLISERIDRVDHILKSISETAKENQKIYKECIKRNLNCLAPNHQKDSFRDTINILTLINYIKEKKYSECYFSTVNYKDFSSGGKKYELHSGLNDDFSKSNLCYIFFDPDTNGNKLLASTLRSKLPSLQEYLEEKKRKELESRFEVNKIVLPDTNESLDKDFLENIKHIDNIIQKANPTPFEIDMISILTKRHENYRNYFIKNVGNNGMV